MSKEKSAHCNRLKSPCLTVAAENEENLKGHLKSQCFMCPFWAKLTTTQLCILYSISTAKSYTGPFKVNH